MKTILAILASSALLISAASAHDRCETGRREIIRGRCEPVRECVTVHPRIHETCVEHRVCETVVREPVCERVVVREPVCEKVVVREPVCEKVVVVREPVVKICEPVVRVCEPRIVVAGCVHETVVREHHHICR